MSEYSKNCKWYNDGVKSYFTSKPDTSWKPGRLGMNGKDNPSSKPEVRAKISKAKYNKPKSTSKKCMCVETGQVFESAKIAAR